MSPLFKWRPNAKDVAKRSIVLFLVYQRGDIEEAGITQRDESEETRKTILYWLSLVGLKAVPTKAERDLLNCPVGSLDDQSRINSFWRGEAGGVLIWALGIADMLPWDIQFGPRHLKRLPVPGTKDEVRQFLESARLRSTDQINRQRDIAELWHWRARTIQLQNQGGQPPKEMGMTFGDIIELSTKAALERGTISQAIGGDFPALGKPYRELGDDEQSLLMSIAMERHYALNWLCGYSKDWDRVPTGT